MGNVLFNMSVSLDGFVAGPNDDVTQVFKWYSSGDTEWKFPGPEMVFKVSQASARLLEAYAKKTGAIITGRRNFDLAKAWGGTPPLGVHHFVVTHHPAQEWVKAGSPFTFVTDGVESAIRQAKAHAGDKDVVISTPSIMRQALKAGLVDQLHLDLVPVLLGNGVRMFEPIGKEPVELENIGVVEGKGVTHLSFRVVK